MSFFCSPQIPKNRILNMKMINRQKNIKTDTLQVRIPVKIKWGRKRAFFFASASMTVEAAIALPLFLFAGVILMMPFKILDVERQMQAIVNSVGETVSQTAYLTGEGEESVRSSELLAEDKEDWWMDMGDGAGLAAYVYAESAVRLKARHLPIEQVSLAQSRILDDGETVNLIVTYEMKLPFSVWGLGAVHRTNACYLRAWVGRDGGTGAGFIDEEDDPIVYVGRGSTRYHISSSCHYLTNYLTAVPVGEIENYRNKSGGKYTSCARCGSQAGGTVYIMPSGEHYHKSRSCSAILAYVSAVRRSTVEHLGPCSYCSAGD